MHLKFVETDPAPKTKKWRVVNKYYNDIDLGGIAWFGKWKKYAFFPNKGTVYDETCLREIAEFCVSQTRLHKEKK